MEAILVIIYAKPNLQFVCVWNASNAIISNANAAKHALIPGRLEDWIYVIDGTLIRHSSITIHNGVLSTVHLFTVTSLMCIQAGTKYSARCRIPKIHVNRNLTA